MFYLTFEKIIKADVVAIIPIGGASAVAGKSFTFKAQLVIRKDCFFSKHFNICRRLAWPVITDVKPPLDDADEWAGKTDKIDLLEK